MTTIMMMIATKTEVLCHINTYFIIIAVLLIHFHYNNCLINTFFIMIAAFIEALSGHLVRKLKKFHNSVNRIVKQVYGGPNDVFFNSL